ncbi:MAG TPA: hypothetical protein VGM95_07185 [Lactobacillaceae bacterium]|jgi:hypothetical protein
MTDFKPDDYAQKLAKDIAHLTALQANVAQLAQSQTVAEIVTATQNITAYQPQAAAVAQLSADAVYAPAHWAMVAFARLLVQVTDRFALGELPGQRLATLQLADWPNTEWQFTAAPLAAGGFYLTEVTHGLRLAYWDLAQKRWYLNHAELLLIVQTQAVRRNGVAATRAVLAIFTQLATLLAENDFQVDSQLIDSAAPGGWPLSGAVTKAQLDELFILAAQENVLLKSAPNGVALHLPDDVTLSLVETAGKWRYALNVTTDSLVTVIQTQVFFATWYEKFQKTVGVPYHTAVFVNKKSDSS